MPSIFITGTDTDVGKTYVSSKLLDAFKAADYKAYGFKPIASGVNTENKNEDALRLMAASFEVLPYKHVNPFCFKKPIAPHIAAEMDDANLSFESIKKAIQDMLTMKADIRIIEGAGGWDLPINRKVLFSEVIAACKLPVVMIVRLRLGCLNHAILTAKRIRSMKVPLVGWVANCMESSMQALYENIATLEDHICAPCLGKVTCDQVDFSDLASTVLYHLKKRLFACRQDLS